MAVQRAGLQNGRRGDSKIRRIFKVAGSEMERVRRRIDALRERLARVIALQRRIQIVVLRGPVIDTKTGPNHSLSVQCVRRPGYSHPRIPVSVIGIKERWVFRTVGSFYRRVWVACA